MRKLTPFLLLSLAFVAFPLFAASGRDQSYITYDDGGAVVRQGDDGREVAARVNFPIYPGDEVTTGRRARTEIRLADGNIIALDRSTSVRFRSIDDSYESDATQSIIEMKFGHVAVQRTNEATELLRIDTPNASYAASDQAVYAVEVDSRGHDRVVVYDGSIEVRTPQRAIRVRSGEEAQIDDQGIYGLVRSDRVDSEFDRWFVRRSERYGNPSSRYLDRSLAYSDYDLQHHGSWVFMASFGGYAWRPRVAVGWRPYYNGRWGYGPAGSLTWISYEPWGWVPYHYGRWGYDPFYGWVWLPGYTYAPAWVYWAYGPGYIGWAPAGWYDCYRPYYNWAYRPYSRGGDFGFGFYGRVRMNEIDLRPWTFVNPNQIVSNRVDQAALTTDAIRQRLIRDPNSSLATVSGTPARFTRSELRDPAAAVNKIVRRGLGGGAGRLSSGAVTDVTPFFRRDPELSTGVRERIVRSRPEPAFTGAPSGVPTPGTRGTLEGRADRDGAGARGDYRPGEASGRVFRDPYGRNDQPAQRNEPRQRNEPVQRNGGGHDNATQREGNWRNWIDRTTPPSQPSTPPSTAGRERPSVDRTPEPQRPPQANWRGRSIDRGSVSREPSTRDRTPSDQPRSYTAPPDRSRDRGADIPRRIIDGIRGARIYSGDAPRETTRSRESAPPPRESTPRSEPPRQERSSPPPQRERSSSPPPQQHSSPSSNGDHGGGGRIQRGH